MSTKFKAFDQIQVERTPTNIFPLTFAHKTSMNIGGVFPLLMQDTLPGDQFTITPELLIRFAPMIFPVYQQIRATIDFFYIPNRVMNTNWKETIAGNLDPLGNEYVPPYLKIDVTPLTVTERSVLDYMGFPLVEFDAGEKILAFPLIAYLMVYNEYYMDQNNDPLYVPLKNKLKAVINLQGAISISDLLPAEFEITNFDFRPFNKAWQNDYFTAALPYAQKGPAVSIPLELVELVGESVITKAWKGVGVPADDGTMTTDTGFIGTGGTPADISFLTGTTTIDGAGAQLEGTINQLRYNEALQKFYEMSARSGTRYNEFIKSAFDVNIGDARINRPEFLGRITNNVMVSEVLQNSASTDTSTLGQYAGYANALVGGNTIRAYCPEHGWIMALVSVAPTTAYYQGLPRKYTKISQLDYPFKQFMHTGEQATLNKEVFYDKTDSLNNNEFGYMPYASEYKVNQDMVTSAFRTSLLPFTLARKFDARPQLNSQFVYIDDAAQKRIFAVTEEDVDPLFVNCIFNIKARRPISFYSTPQM